MIVTFYVVVATCKLHVREIIKSDHLPLDWSFILTCQKKISVHQEILINLNNYIDRLYRKAAFSCQINSEETRAKLSHAMYLIDVDWNKALDMFNAISKQQADCMKKRINVNQNRNKLVVRARIQRSENKCTKNIEDIWKALDSCDMNTFCKVNNFVYRKKTSTQCCFFKRTCELCKAPAKLLAGNT